VRQADAYATLAARLPHGARWVVTPLSRTSRTAEAIFAAGHPAAMLTVEPDLIEQDLGDWQGLEHAALPPLLTRAAHAFWPLDAEERPPGGESVADMIIRVGRAIERLAAAGGDTVVVAHGGSIRATLAHVLGLTPHQCLAFSVQNLSLTRIERHGADWQVACVNESPGA
jgi:broad specificity phosphatase PhoE